MFNRTFMPTATSERDVSDFLERPHVDEVPLRRSRVHVEIHLDHQDLIYGWAVVRRRREHNVDMPLRSPGLG